jgi:hypothetical protein
MAVVEEKDRLLKSKINAAGFYIKGAVPLASAVRAVFTNVRGFVSTFWSFFLYLSINTTN